VTAALAVDRDPARRLAHLDGKVDSLRSGQPASRHDLNLSSRIVAVRDHRAIIVVAP
jgi:hypothetical protein